MTRRLMSGIAALGVASASFALSGVPAAGADTTVVNAKVTVASPCLTVSNRVTGGSSLDFGALSFTTATINNTLTRSQALTLANCAGSSEDVLVRGSNATSASGNATWALQGVTGTAVCNAGVNKYALTSLVRAANGTLRNGVPETVLLTVNQLTESGLPPGARDVDVGLTMPCMGSSGAGEIMDFQITYTASL